MSIFEIKSTASFVEIFVEWMYNPNSPRTARRMEDCYVKQYIEKKEVNLLNIW